MEEQLQEALNAIGLDASSTASKICPVDTGLLKNSITYATKSRCNFDYTAYADNPKGDRVFEDLSAGVVDDKGTVVIGTDIEYAPYQEYGTMNGVPASHFLQFGASRHLKEYKDIIEKHLKGGEVM